MAPSPWCRPSETFKRGGMLLLRGMYGVSPSQRVQQTTQGLGRMPGDRQLHADEAMMLARMLQLSHARPTTAAGSARVGRQVRMRR